MNKRTQLQIFILTLIFSLIFWRLWTRLFYNQETTSILRTLTGLNIHHYHYGIILVLIATLFFIFYKKTNLTIALAGFGFGTYFDGFISRLIIKSQRQTEIINYNQNFIPTIIFFTFLIFITLIFYWITENHNTSP